jgi:hypothetical protein
MSHQSVNEVIFMYEHNILSHQRFELQSKADFSDGEDTLLET